MSDFNEKDHPRAEAGRFANKPQTSDNVTLTAERLTVVIGDVRPGDAVYFEDEFRGIAADIHEVQGKFVSATTEDMFVPQTRVLLADGSAFRGDADDVVTVDRSGIPLSYSPENRYWMNVQAAADARQDPDVLFQIAVDETEDDFMRAVAANPSSRADAIEEASKHHAFTVRHAAVNNANTSRETIQRILDDAIIGEADARMRAVDEGVSPMQGQYIWDADQQALLAATARARLNGM